MTFVGIANSRRGVHWGLGIRTRGGLDIGTGLGIRIVLTVVRIPRLSRYLYGTDKICTLSES